MISYEELVEMVREASTEQLPIAVLTIKEVRQFAEKVALDCINIVEMPDMAKKDIARVIITAESVTEQAPPTLVLRTGEETEKSA